MKRWFNNTLNTCERLLVFEDVLDQIVDQLNTSLLGWFIRCILFRLEKLEEETM